MQIETPAEKDGTPGIDKETGFAELTKGPEKTEKKLIPALDIKSMESVDSLTFSIILHEECLLNCYDVLPSTPSRKQSNRTSSLINAFGSILNNGSGKDSDGGFPMAFESEHVPELIQGFHKLQ